VAAGEGGVSASVVGVASPAVCTRARLEGDPVAGAGRRELDAPSEEWSSMVGRPRDAAVANARSAARGRSFALVSSVPATGSSPALSSAAAMFGGQLRINACMHTH
jgi:hypothetical protein